MALWCSGYLYCTTSFNKAWTQVLLVACRRIGMVRISEVVPVGKKAKRLSSVNHTTEQLIIIILIIIWKHHTIQGWLVRGSQTWIWNFLIWIMINLEFLLEKCESKKANCKLSLLHMRTINGVVSWCTLTLQRLFHFTACVLFLSISFFFSYFFVDFTSCLDIE